MGEKLLDIFNDEIRMITNMDRQAFVKDLLMQASDDLINWQSSSTGKYHPQDETCPEGMVIHIKRCCALAGEISRMHSLGDYGAELLVAGGLVHDAWKRGYEGTDPHTNKMHMIIAYKKVMATKYKGDDLFQKHLARIVLFHEGKWSPPECYQFDDEPYGKANRAMHEIDMFTSRRICWEYMQPEWAEKIIEQVKVVRG